MTSNTPQRALSSLVLALAAAVPLAWPVASASAQTVLGRYAEPVVTGFGVEPVQRLQPGEVLIFRVQGTPDARVVLQIAGATTNLQMNETQPGAYEGEYTIRQRDRLAAGSQVNVRIEKNGQASNAVLAQSIQAGAPTPVAASRSQIERFSVDAPARVGPGDEISFSLQGTPGGQANVTVQGIAGNIALTEVRRGVYEGSHVVRRKDKLRGAVVADAHLIVDRQEATRRNDNDDRRGQPVASCNNCGTVVAVNTVKVKDDHPNVVGTIAGGVLGGVLGRQVGGGTGRDLATIAGAVGGAYAGNRIEDRMEKKDVVRVSVKLDSGATSTVDYAQAPGLRVGERVRLVDGVLARL